MSLFLYCLPFLQNEVNFCTNISFDSCVIIFKTDYNSVSQPGDRKLFLKGPQTEYSLLFFCLLVMKTT
jgi:hypothetical protein